MCSIALYSSLLSPLYIALIRDSISRYVLISKKTFSDVVNKESRTQQYNMKVRCDNTISGVIILYPV